jgi:hypothetical protein
MQFASLGSGDLHRGIRSDWLLSSPVEIRMAMLHDRFDIERFSAMFPLTVLRSQARDFVLDRQKRVPDCYPNQEAVERHVRLMEPRGEIITSPCHMAVVEQLRAEALFGVDSVEKTPTDAFVFAWGEPADRRLTKIGGLPYWPKERNWPPDHQGRPLHFIAQFCFGDSDFIRQELPGDLLLVFGNSEHCSAESLVCHWVQSSASAPIDSADVPQTENPLLPLYGVLHRTYDCVAEQSAFCRFRSSEKLSRIEGTKIGGLPRWIQNEPKSHPRFLCALGSIGPVSNSPYPYVNFERPVGFREVHDRRLLKWGDAGSVYFFLRDDGQVDWIDQCY